MQPAPRRWEYKPADSLDGLDPILGRILAARGFGADDARALVAQSSVFHDPFQLRGMREAVETMVFLPEAAADRKVGLSVPRTEMYERLAIKLATGAGKTLVMAMLIVWSALNKVANRQDPRFADAFLVVCPNLTVKRRLTEIEGLLPSHP